MVRGTTRPIHYVEDVGESLIIFKRRNVLVVDTLVQGREDVSKLWVSLYTIEISLESSTLQMIPKI